MSSISPQSQIQRSRPGRRDPAVVIAERRQKTLDEFSLSITRSLKAEEKGGAPEDERVQAVVGNFLSQSTVTIRERERTVILPLLKPDGALSSGNVARAMQFYLGSSEGRSSEERWRHAWIGLVRDFGGAHRVHGEGDDSVKRGVRAETRESSGSVLSLFLPSVDEIIRQGERTDWLWQEALAKKAELLGDFDQLEREVLKGAVSSEEISLAANRIFGSWTPSIDIRGLTAALLRAASGKPARVDGKTLSEVKAFLSRPDILRKYFPAAFTQTEAVALESDLLFAFASNPEEIGEALRGEFQWTGIFYLKKSPAEKSVLELVKRDGQHFHAIPHGGKQSVRSRNLGQEGEAPLVWGPGNILNFSGDKAREAQFKERGFQIAKETLPLLVAQQLSLRETLMLLKLFSVSERLRGGLFRSEDGFRILTGHGLKTGLEILAELWTREAETDRQLSEAA